MGNEVLTRLVASPGPFVSLHFDDTHIAHDAARQVAARWTSIHRKLEDSAVPAHLITAIGKAVNNRSPAVGRSGRLVIADRDEILVDERLSTAPSEMDLRVSDYPYMLPLFGAAHVHRSHIFAAVDHLGATITTRSARRVWSETVTGPGFPVHKAATAGWRGYADIERSAEEAIRMNVRVVAQRITELADCRGTEIVFVSGDNRTRNAVASELPRRIAALLVPLSAGAQGVRAVEQDFADEITALYVERQHTATRALVSRLTCEIARHSGLAVQGLPSVCTAVQDGTVDSLVIGSLGPATVVVGQNSRSISPVVGGTSGHGLPSRRTARADEALPYLAITTNASIVYSEEHLGLADGVGALLRYAS